MFAPITSFSNAFYQLTQSWYPLFFSDFVIVYATPTWRFFKCAFITSSSANSLFGGMFIGCFPVVVVCILEFQTDFSRAVALLCHPLSSCPLNAHFEFS